ncbi:MFS transporter [uncultured Virgibacillus sp.]|uniref:MFS transporter n=1 Tax=uncultured Virgibacillus sp. TaxID=417355 RepID=UPI0026199A9B|nr:MFS transporter [uncultured Virgibacillus sp.]
MKLLIGRLFSNAGDSLYAIASMWLVQELTHSTFYTGLVGFLTLFPQALTFLIGPLVDKLNLKKILVYTQLFQSILISIIPIAYYGDFLSVTLVLIIMPVVSFTNQFFYPTQNVVLPYMVSKDNLVHANSLFTFTYQGTDLTLKAVGGVLIGMFGAISIYIIDSIAFLITALLLLTIKIPERSIQKSAKSSFKVEVKHYFLLLKEGFAFVIKSVLIWLFVISSLGNLIIGMVFAILPSFADRFSGPETYGFILASMSSGLLIGALAASWLSKYPMGLLTVFLFFIGGTSWIISGFIKDSVLVIILFGIAWVPMGATNILLFTFIQSNVPELMIGRVVSLITSISMSLMPLGAFLGGIIGEIQSSQFVYTISGTSLLIISLYCLFHPTIRKIPKISNIQPERYGLNNVLKENG